MRIAAKTERGIAYAAVATALRARSTCGVDTAVTDKSDPRGDTVEAVLVVGVGLSTSGLGTPGISPAAW